MRIAWLLAVLSAGPAPLEIAVPPGLARGTLLLLDAPVAPTRVELLPGGVPVAAAWYREGERVLITLRAPEDTTEQSRLGVWPADAVPPGTAVLTLRPPVAVASLPLQEPLHGPALGLELPPRSSLRALLLRGELASARLRFEGRILSTREPPFRGRTVALVPPGPAGLLVLAPGSPGVELSLETASLHAGYPLPAPETFVLPPGASGEYSFEVPERWGDAVVSFEAFDADRPGELSVEFEGQGVPVRPGSEPAAPGRWSDTRELLLPASAFAHGRRSILTFRLAPPAVAATPATPLADAGAGLRHLNLDVPLPTRTSYGLGPGGDGDHGGELLLSWWPAEPGAHVLRLRAAGLDRSGEIGVRVLGAELGTVGMEHAFIEREGEVLLPAEMIRAGELNTIQLRPARAPWGGVEWSVSDLRVLRLPPPALADAAGPSALPRESGPTVAQTRDVQPGSASLSETIAVPDALPGVAAAPVGGIAYVAGVPVADPAAGEPAQGGVGERALSGDRIGPPAPVGPPAPAQAPTPPTSKVAPGESTAMGPPAPHGPPAPGGLPAAPPPSGPSVARQSPSGAAGEGLPGAATLVRGPELPPFRRPELPPTKAVAPRGAEVQLRSEPPGAQVFLSRTPGVRGNFLGLTPVSVDETAIGPAFFRFVRAGSHEAQVAAWLPGQGSLKVSRALLPWQGIDFSRPADPRDATARAPREGYAAPAAADLDGDGRVDLVLGGDKGGLWWLRNEEPMGSPRFGVASPLKRSDGRPLGVGGYAAPAVADWDGDGLGDLLVGARSGEVHFFRRLPPSRGLAFEDRGVLVADGVALSAGNDAVPMVIDWNGDAHPDLLVGSGYGVVVLFEGQGHGALTQRGPVQVDGAALQFLLDVAPIDFSDWTGDGRRDLVLAGMYGNVLLYPGRGGPGGTPDFAAARPITIRGGLDLYVGTYPHGFALDLDGDGYRDLVFGNAGGEILWLRGGEPHEFDELEPVSPLLPARRP